MSGTIVCGVADSPGGRDAIQFAVALSRRLDQRLVLVFIREAIGRRTGLGSLSEGRDQSSADLLQELRRDFCLGEKVEWREAPGGAPLGLAQIAGEEGADLIVLWSRRSKLGRHSVECRLALELEPMTAIPVVIAPPQTRPRSERRLAVV